MPWAYASLHLQTAQFLGYWTCMDPAGGRETSISLAHSLRLMALMLHRHASCYHIDNLTKLHHGSTHKRNKFCESCAARLSGIL